MNRRMMIKEALNEQLEWIYKLYMEAFPENERKPFKLMQEKAKEGKMEILAIEKEGRLVGLAITILYRDMVLLDYFAMHQNERGKGLGGQAIEQLKKRYQNKRIFLGIETLDEKADNYDERVRRKAFYLSHGLAEAKIYVLLFGVEMELLTVQGQISYKEYKRVYTSTFGETFEDKIQLLNYK